MIFDIYETDWYCFLVKLKQVCFICFYCVLIFATIVCFPIVSKVIIVSTKKHVDVAVFKKRKNHKGEIF